MNQLDYGAGEMAEEVETPTQGRAAEMFTWSINSSVDVPWPLGGQNTDQPLIRPTH